MSHQPLPVGVPGAVPDTTNRILPAEIGAGTAPTPVTEGQVVQKHFNLSGQAVPPAHDQSQSADRVSEVAPALLIPLDQTMLDGVTAATDSAPIDFTNFIMKNFFINVSVNTGAATVTIEGSEDDGATFAYEIWAKTYTATTGKDNVIIASHWTHIRVTTTTHANATVTVKVRARGGA